MPWFGSLAQKQCGSGCINITKIAGLDICNRSSTVHSGKKTKITWKKKSNKTPKLAYTPNCCKAGTEDERASIKATRSVKDVTNIDDPALDIAIDIRSSGGSLLSVLRNWPMMIKVSSTPRPSSKKGTVCNGNTTKLGH